MRKVLIAMAGLGRVPRWLAMLAVAAGALLGSAVPVAAGVAPAPASTVAADLGADKIPAALVILVDTSDSMAPPTGLYPRVYAQLPKFLAALARQDPQDEVAVVQFAGKEATRTISPMAPPTPDIPLLRNPTFTGGTDIGYAFQVALGDLAQDKNAQVGGVMLLSDGGLSEPSDPVYDGGEGYQAPGWAKLRQQVQGLGIPVTGYGLPLTSSQADISGLDAALSACFGPQQVTLTSNFNDLSSQFATTQQKILNSRVAVAAAPDSLHGVKVTWGGTGVSDGTVQLNPSTGHAQLSLK
jgi:von Willebrand factor type A domain